MKNLIVAIVLVLLVLFAIDTIRDRLPHGPPTVASCAINEGSSWLQRGALGITLGVETWEIHDYGLFKIAHGPNTGWTLVADPISKKWSRMDTEAAD